MDASEFFNDVVKPNYEDYCYNQNQLRQLWNAVVSMNTVAEYVALDRLGYKEVGRVELFEKAKEIRKEHPILLDLKVCAETLKHVRKLDSRVRTQATATTSSTGLLSTQPASWVIDYGTSQYVLSDVLHRAFSALRNVPEVK
jgi:hypothetical protein